MFTSMFLIGLFLVGINRVFKSTNKLMRSWCNVIPCRNKKHGMRQIKYMLQVWLTTLQATTTQTSTPLVFIAALVLDILALYSLET